MESSQTTLAITWIDAVLNYVAAPTEDPPSGELPYTNYIEDTVAWQHLSLMYPEMKTQAFQSILPRILDKLYKDGYVHAKDVNFSGLDRRVYAVTFEGTLFSQNGGYRAQLDATNADADHRATEAQRNKYQYWVTVSIGVSTGIAAIYYFLEIRQKHSGFYGQIYPFVLTGILSLIPLTMLVGVLWRSLKHRLKHKQSK